MADIREITASHHIICEGPDDIALLCRLIRDRGIADIQVGCGRKSDGEDRRCLGTSGFSNRILALKGIVPPSPVTRGVIIATDCDDDPNGRFVYACEQLEAHGLPSPENPFEIAGQAGPIKTGVIMFPDTGREGGLESVLLACSDYPQNGFRQCIEDFHHCAGSPNWPEKDLHKVQLRLLIAATRPDDPGMGLSFWLSSQNRPFPMTHPALNKIADFITAFVNA